MKQFLIFAGLFYSGLLLATPAIAPMTAVPAAEEWNASSLSDALITKIQTATYEYKTCAATEMQKPEYATIDVRKATETVIKQCEVVLGKMRTAYLSEQVPAIIADRQLKTMRIQTTRNLLAELMFRDAARKAGQ